MSSTYVLRSKRVADLEDPGFKIRKRCKKRLSMPPRNPGRVKKNDDLVFVKKNKTYGSRHTTKKSQAQAKFDQVLVPKVFFSRHIQIQTFNSNDPVNSKNPETWSMLPSIDAWSTRPITHSFLEFDDKTLKFINSDSDEHSAEELPDKKLSNDVPDENVLEGMPEMIMEEGMETIASDSYQEMEAEKLSEGDQMLEVKKTSKQANLPEVDQMKEDENMSQDAIVSEDEKMSQETIISDDQSYQSRDEIMPEMIIKEEEMEANLSEDPKQISKEAIISQGTKETLEETDNDWINHQAEVSKELKILSEAESSASWSDNEGIIWNKIETMNVANSDAIAHVLSEKMEESDRDEKQTSPYKTPKSILKKRVRIITSQQQLKYTPSPNTKQKYTPIPNIKYKSPTRLNLYPRSSLLNLQAPLMYYPNATTTFERRRRIFHKHPPCSLHNLVKRCKEGQRY